MCNGAWDGSTFDRLFLVPIADLRLIPILIDPVDNMLQLLQKKAAFHFRTKRFAKDTQITGVTTANVDEQNVFVRLWSPFYQSLSEGIPAVFPEERLACVVHLDHTTKALRHGRVLAEVSVQGFVLHVVRMLERSVVDVDGVAMGDEVEERWDLPANIVEVVEPNLGAVLERKSWE